jgi:hypothetical protein
VEELAIISAEVRVAHGHGLYVSCASGVHGARVET